MIGNLPPTRVCDRCLDGVERLEGSSPSLPCLAWMALCGPQICDRDKSLWAQVSCFSWRWGDRRRTDCTHSKRQHSPSLFLDMEERKLPSHPPTQFLACLWLCEHPQGLDHTWWHGHTGLRGPGRPQEGWGPCYGHSELEGSQRCFNIYILSLTN